MNGALPPKRYELSWNWRITLAMVLPLVDRLHIPLGRSLVELARPADLVFRIGNHLLPLRDPADGAREREGAGEHRHRDAQRPLHDAGVEVDVGIKLAAEEIIVLHRDSLEVQCKVEQAAVLQPQLVQRLVARLPQ